MIDMPTKQASTEMHLAYGWMFLTSLSDCIRNETGIVTMAVSNIHEPDLVNSILTAGRTDRVERRYLANPYWTPYAALGNWHENWPMSFLYWHDQAWWLVRGGQTIKERV